MNIHKSTNFGTSAMLNRRNSGALKPQSQRRQSCGYVNQLLNATSRVRILFSSIRALFDTKEALLCEKSSGAAVSSALPLQSSRCLTDSSVVAAHAAP